MKAFNLILIAGALVVASCDDESMNLDKARIVNVVSRSEVNVELIGSVYQLSWEQPEIYTQRGAAIAAGKGCFSYDVCLSPAYTTDTLVFIKTVDSCGAVLLRREVEDALGRFSSYAQDYRFCVCLSDTTIPTIQPFYSAVQMANKNTISRFYETYNHWFTQKSVDASVNGNNEAAIRSESNEDIWDVQFCNVFHGLKNQAQGNRFSLSFDIKWIGDSPRNKEAYLTIYTGKYVKKKGSDILVPDDDLAWSEANTQLIFDDGLVETMNRRYIVYRSEWKKITLEGEIGEMGADIIAIQINLSGYERNGIKYLNTDGTFIIRNMVVRMDNEISAAYFGTDYFVDVKSNGDGDVSGGGLYMGNETATLTATPNEGYDFVRWHDVDNGTNLYDNPLHIIVEENINLVAEFAKVNYLEPLQFEDTEYYFNQWFTDGGLTTQHAIPYTLYKGSELAYMINVPIAGDEWSVSFCNILHKNKDQIEGNKFNMTFDVYWESKYDIDSAEIHLVTGKRGWGSTFVHDDWQWNPDDNTELLTETDKEDVILIKEDVFLKYVQHLPRKIPNNEWFKVSWGDELKIGEKGEEYIGIQIDLNNLQGTNIGTFFFRNIEITMGEDTYLVDYSDY